MTVFHAIVAMSENRAIASEGKLPWHIPLEYRWFKHKTMGSAMIMGRKTAEAIGKQLPGRRSYILSRQGGECLGSRCYPTFAGIETALPADETAWIIGGAEIYRQLLPRCARLYLSRIKQTTPGDVFMPVFDDQFSLDQLIHENDQFRVERWMRPGTQAPPPEPWPF